MLEAVGKAQTLGRHPINHQDLGGSGDGRAERRVVCATLGSAHLAFEELYAAPRAARRWRRTATMRSLRPSSIWPLSITVSAPASSAAR
jgi:hypothetical protein